MIFDSTDPIGAAESLYLEATAEQLSGDVVERRWRILETLDALARDIVSAGGRS